MGEIWREKLACAYFFVLPALAYGILTSRLPAIKIAASLDTAQVGSLLLSLGISTLAGLLCADFFIERYTAHKITCLAGAGLMISLSASVFLSSFYWILGCLFLGGICVGFCDVGMNAQGIYLEKKHGILCLAFLHACSSIGGACGAITGFICASFDISPFLNFIIALGLYSLLFFWAWKTMPVEREPAAHERDFFAQWRGIPFFVIYCGILSLLCHIVEGSAGEWGSLLLTTVKGASQQVAALVFAAFTGGMVLSRLLTDSARLRINDFYLAFFGALGGFLGMCLVLLSPWPLGSIAGYGIMGFSVAPITPILFSRAGQIKTVSSGQASAVVSIFSYTGLLFFPPFFGMLGSAWGLGNALWLIAIFCLCIAFGSFPLKKHECA